MVIRWVKWPNFSQKKMQPNKCIYVFSNQKKKGKNERKKSIFADVDYWFVKIIMTISYF